MCVAELEQQSCGHSACEFVSVCGDSSGCDCTNDVEQTGPDCQVETAAQTELTFAIHDAVSVVADSPIEAVFAGRVWQASVAINMHVACVERVSMHLQGIDEDAEAITDCEVEYENSTNTSGPNWPQSAASGPYWSDTAGVGMREQGVDVLRPSAARSPPLK